MTRDEIYSMRISACNHIIFLMIDAFGFGGKKSYTAPHITRTMEFIKDKVFNELKPKEEIGIDDHNIISSFLHSILNMFEGMMLHKEGCHVLELMYLGVKDKVKRGEK